MVCGLALVAGLGLGTVAEASEDPRPSSEPSDAPAEVEGSPGAAEEAERDGVEAADSTSDEPPLDDAVQEPTTVTLEIRSEPSGALVAVDGVMVGTTPLDHPASTGDHQVELFLQGFRLHAEAVTVTAETAPSIAPRLEVDPFSAPPDPKYARRSIIAVSLLLGSTAALLASGGTLLGLDTKPVRRRCREYESAGIVCPHRHDTEVAGTVLVLSSLGTVIAASVTAMAFNQRVRKRRDRPVQRRPAWTGLAVAF